jgi:hypothetical protein
VAYDDDHKLPFFKSMPLTTLCPLKKHVWHLAKCRSIFEAMQKGWLDVKQQGKHAVLHNYWYLQTQHFSTQGGSNDLEKAGPGTCIEPKMTNLAFNTYLSAASLRVRPHPGGRMFTSGLFTTLKVSEETIEFSSSCIAGNHFLIYECKSI